MRSIRKISLLVAMTAAAIAVLAPAAASAASIEDPYGELMQPGTALQVATDDFSITWGSAYTYCYDVPPISAELIENDGQTVEIEGGQPVFSNCNWGAQKRATDVEITALNLTGSGTGSMSMNIDQNWGLYTCELEGTLPLSFTPGTNVLNVSGYFQKHRNCTGWKLTGRFLLEEPNGAAVVVN